MDRAIAKAQAKYGPQEDSNKKPDKEGKSEDKKDRQTSPPRTTRRVREVDLLDLDPETESDQEGDSKEKTSKKALPDPAKLTDTDKKEKEIRAGQELEHAARGEDAKKAVSPEKLLRALKARREEDEKTLKRLLSPSESDKSSVQELLQKLGLSRDLVPLSTGEEN